MVKIIIDNRESAKFQKIVARVCKEFKPVRNTLELGDIIIEDDTNEKRIVIERKTIADYKASMFKDGRGKEQCYRLRTLKYPMYLIEGKINYKTEKMYKSIQQSMTNIQIRDNIPIIRMLTPTASAHEILRIAKCVAKHGIDKYTSRVDSIEKSIKYKGAGSSRGKFINNDDMYKAILRIFPKIGPKIQEAIYDKYPTFGDLVHQCRENSGMEIYEIKYGKRKSKIPKKIVQNLIKFINN